MRRVLLATAALAVLLPWQAQARPWDGPADARPRDLRVVQEDGVSLSEAIRRVREAYGDVTILKAETRGRNGRRYHEIKILTDSGRVRTVRVDADSGQIR